MKIRVADLRPYTTKTGKTMFFLKTDEGVECSTFDDVSKVNIGDYLEGEITDSDKLDKNGVPYKNFHLPRKTDLLEQRINELEVRVKALEDASTDGIPF